MKIGVNDSLTSLTGLDGVTSVGGLVHIHDNLNLASLSGLEGLISIGEDLGITGHAALTDLEPLEGLAFVGGELVVHSNGSLTTLTGLHNIDPNSVEHISIRYNTMLCECDIQSICEYLVAQNGSINIYNNAPGCNSIEEVEEACLEVGIEEAKLTSFTIHPNPTDNGFITLILDTPNNLYLSCFNIFGQQVHQQDLRTEETTINVSSWSPGIYLVLAYEDGKPVGRSKFVVR
jgi:hypothetical protein